LEEERRHRRNDRGSQIKDPIRRSRQTQLPPSKKNEGGSTFFIQFSEKKS
jgi:hypothetical protein